jgi:hypothetical protein
MVKITKIEKILTDSKDVSDFVLITFKTDLGNTRTTRYPIQDVNDAAKLKQFVYEKAKFFDAKDSFSPITTTIEISKDDVDPIEPPPTEEQKFLNAVSDLEQWKRYLDLGIVTETQYADKVSKVKKLIPVGYFDTSSSKE